MLRLPAIFTISFLALTACSPESDGISSSATPHTARTVYAYFGLNGIKEAIVGARELCRRAEAKGLNIEVSPFEKFIPNLELQNLPTIREAVLTDQTGALHLFLGFETLGEVPLARLISGDSTPRMFELNTFAQMPFTSAIQVQNANLSRVTYHNGKALFKIEPVILDFGILPPNATTEPSSVKITNLGDAPLKFGGVTTSCGCTVVSPSTRTISHGEVADLQVTVAPKSGKGFFETVMLNVTQDGSDEPVATDISVVGNYASLVDVSPGTIDFGKVSIGQEALRKVRIAGISVEDLTIQDVDLKGLPLDFRLYQDEVLNSKVYMVELIAKIHTGTPFGKSEAVAEMRTNSSLEPVLYLPILIERVAIAQLVPSVVALDLMDKLDSQLVRFYIAQERSAYNIRVASVSSGIIADIGEDAKGPFLSLRIDHEEAKGPFDGNVVLDVFVSGQNGPLEEQVTLAVYGMNKSTG